MKSKLLFSVLLFMSTFILFAQEEHICLTESISPPLQGRSNNNTYSGAYNIEYLENFESKTFNIFFWGINKTNGTSQKPMLESDVMNVMRKINEFFNPYGICFVLKGYDYINSDQMYDQASSLSQILNYASYPQNNPEGAVYVEPNSFNCYVPYKYGVSGNGISHMYTQFLTAKMYSDKFTDGVVVAHELGHNLGLHHTFGKDNVGNIIYEHVTRDPNDPNYNALTKGDDVHDTPAMPNFKNTNWGAILDPETGNIIPTVDLSDCSYTGNGTDLLGVPFVITPYDVGNIMSYSPQECQTHFTIGQAVRMYETIENYTIFSQLTLPNLGTDLYIRDSFEDFGQEPNNIEATWRSPDIWVRNVDDGQDGHENPIYSPFVPNYVYVRVRNRGCSVSSGEDQLKLYWSKASTSLAWDAHWNGSSFPQGPLRGAEIATLAIPPLESGEETILKFPWFPPNPAIYEGMNPEPWHFCLLARIESVEDPIGDETTILGHNVRNNNNIAQKNVSVIKVASGTGTRAGATVAIGNPYHNPKSFLLNFAADTAEIGKKIFEEAEVTIVLDDILRNAWEAGGQQMTNIVRRSQNTFMITDDNASLGNMVFTGNQTGTLFLQFNFLTQEVTEKELYTYHIVQKDNVTKEVLGGETYEIQKDPRSLFYAITGGNIEADKNETVVLSAEPISEPALYNWYDIEGNLIYEGADYTTSVEVGKKYKLEVIALSDGYKDYSEIEVSLKPNEIKTLSPNPASGMVTVTYKINEGDTAYLSVTDIYNPNISNNYILDINQSLITFDTTIYSQGIYAIALIVNGQIADTTTLIKQ